MLNVNSRILFPISMNELWAEWSRFNDANLFSGSENRLYMQTGKLFFLPETALVLDNIGELRKIDRTERYLEIGSMVALNSITTLGKIIPEALMLAIKSTTTYLLRNLTTIGNCICKQSTPEPVVAALVALDSRYELKTSSQSYWVPASQFSAFHQGNMLKPQECLTRIRIPLESWDYTLCRDFSAKESGDNGNEFAVFLAKIQKNILADIRFIFSGTTILRDKNSELELIGSKLPLDKKNTENFITIWRNHLSAIEGRSEFQKSKLLNFIEQAISYFAY